MSRTHRQLAVGTCAVAVLLLTVPGSVTATAAPSDPSPTPSAELPGADDPTSIPTGGMPSLPGEGSAGDDAQPVAHEYSEPPDNIGDSKPPVKVDPQAKGLKLADGAELADPKVLDVKFVTEDLGGEERREESTVKTKFTLQAEVLFPKDSPKLNADGRSRIDQIAAEIGKQKATKVNVFGFTDDLGSYEHGKTLSKNRAATVQKELAKKLGANVAFNVRGYSEDYPIADNGTEEGRKKNRRVEVSFPRED